MLHNAGNVMFLLFDTKHPGVCIATIAERNLNLRYNARFVNHNFGLKKDLVQNVLKKMFSVYFRRPVWHEWIRTVLEAEPTTCVFLKLLQHVNS